MYPTFATIEVPCGMVKFNQQDGDVKVKDLTKIMPIPVGAVRALVDAINKDEDVDKGEVPAYYLRAQAISDTDAEKGVALDVIFDRAGLLEDHEEFGLRSKQIVAHLELSDEEAMALAYQLQLMVSMRGRFKERGKEGRWGG